MLNNIEKEQTLNELSTPALDMTVSDDGRMMLGGTADDDSKLYVEGNVKVEQGDLEVKSGQLCVNGICNNDLSKQPAVDNRKENLTPTQYYAKGKGMGTHKEFKETSATGLKPMVANTYCTLETIVPWHDYSNIPIIQTAYVSRFQVYRRESTAAQQWTTWRLVSGDAYKQSIEDTRDVNEMPKQYYDRGMGIYHEFKTASSVGLQGSYYTLETVVPWKDFSGGNVVQTATNASKNL